MDILHTLGDLIANLGRLAYELIALGWQYILLIVWVAWWLWGVNWKRTWPVLREGAWAPLVLLMIVTALAWSRLAPGPCECLGFAVVPNFWWQLGYVAMLVAIALLCGWLQGVFAWAPAEINLDPPAHGHGHDGHGHDDHGHEHDDHSHRHDEHGHSHAHGSRGHGHH
jgi:hypothetical protein